LLLSKKAVESSWVDREWKSAYWDEVNRQSIVILPILLEKCDVPRLLMTKKYASFHKSYAIGFHELIGAVDVYSKARGLITSYELSSFDLPRIIRADKELTELTISQMTAKASRFIEKPVAVKKANVLQINESQLGHVNFYLCDSTGIYFDCFIIENTSLEDLIINQPSGNFYGVMQNFPQANSFIISEYEQQ
jgi:hypothetical protein